jgi:DNA uptake protein ComE-like DNA-binding protein
MKKSSILIFTIWVMVFLGILNTALYRTISSQVSLLRRIESRTKSYYLAKAACSLAKAKIKQRQLKYDSMAWTRNWSEFGSGDYVLKYRLIDEESKINLNNSSLEALSSLPGLNQELADKILKSKLRPFERKEDLLFVEGITSEVFDKVKDFITVYGFGKININTAPREVLLALGLNEPAITAIEQFRRGRDGKELTDDDGIFEDRDSIIENLRQSGMIYAADQIKVLSLVTGQILDVLSQNFCLEARVYLGPKLIRAYDIITDGKIINSWQEM